MDVALVKKLRKVSAGLLRERWDDTASRNPVSVCWQAKGKEISEGMIGSYHHLGPLAR